MTASRPAPQTAALALLSAATLGLGAAATGGVPAPGASGGATSVRALVDSPPLDVALYDRTRGRMLPLWLHDGELYVAGEAGHEYEIRLRSASAGRVLAVTSVDGVNVVTGETAAPGQAGYVIDADGRGTIDGWRKSLGDVASFVFTTPRRSYAARTGRPDDVGVIGIAMFREAPPHVAPAAPAPWLDRADEAMAAAAAADASAAAGDAAGARRERSASAATASPRLGTGHGARRGSPATRTGFERASARPDAIVRIYYDSLASLVARGIVPATPRHVRRPEPFPGVGFVPDP